MNSMNNGNKRLRNISLFTGILAAVCAALFFLWNSGSFLPGWIVWKNVAFSFSDSDSDSGSGQPGRYGILLSHKTVRVFYDGTLIWTSPKGVKVQDVLSFDIDNDRQDELILLCWKIGRYGAQKPFWVDEDERKWSQHIFLYEYGQGEIKPKWMSSYLGQDVTEMTANVREKTYNRLFLTDLDRKVNGWKWDSWGFTKEDTDVSFTVCGDNLIHEPIYRYALRSDTSFGFLFHNLKDTISQSDIAVIHQETPLTDNPSLYGGYPRFGTPAGVGNAIADAGFDVAVCATNHAMDRGADGVSFTKEFFVSHGITCLGIQSEDEKDYRPYEILEKNGIRFALLNYTYGTNGIPLPADSPHMVHLLEEEEKIKNDIRQAKAASDFVLIFVHWGTEYTAQPDISQQAWTQLFLECEADVVIGTHPHALQPYGLLESESGHKMLVYYSIGNYISAQKEKTCVKGGLATFTVSLTSDGYAVTEYGLQPLSITHEGGGKFMVDFDSR